MNETTAALACVTLNSLADTKADKVVYLPDLDSDAPRATIKNLEPHGFVCIDIHDFDTHYLLSELKAAYQQPCKDRSGIESAAPRLRSRHCRFTSHRLSRRSRFAGLLSVFLCSPCAVGHSHN